MYVDNHVLVKRAARGNGVRMMESMQEVWHRLLISNSGGREMTIATAQQRAASHCLDDGLFKSKAIVSTLIVPSLSLSLFFRLSMDSSQTSSAAIQAASDA